MLVDFGSLVGCVVYFSLVAFFVLCLVDSFASFGCLVGCVFGCFMIGSAFRF